MELIKINAAEYGLEETKAQQIEKSFAVIAVERDGIIAIYEELIKSEITPEICERAGKLNTALSKVNASLNRVHKAEKLYYLSGGKFCDAIKNKNRIAIEEMQLNLIALKDHYENERKAKIAKLQEERSEAIAKYIDVIPVTLGLMTKEVWENFFSGTKANHKAMKEAEKKVERQRIDREKAAREEKKRIIAENEKLRLEAIERERIAQIEAKKRKAEGEERAKEEAERLRKENEAKRLREEKERKERAEYAAKLQKERDERERVEKEARAKQKRLENELREKIEAEKKRKQAIEDKKQAELNMGDADKVEKLIIDLGQLKTKYQFESANNKKMYVDVGNLLNKIIVYISK